MHYYYFPPFILPGILRHYVPALTKLNQIVYVIRWELFFFLKDNGVIIACWIDFVIALENQTLKNIRFYGAVIVNVMVMNIKYELMIALLYAWNDIIYVHRCEQIFSDFIAIFDYWEIVGNVRLMLFYLRKTWSSHINGFSVYII